jgi:processive 1,2-diacylglycerol beta-glucosyltransferase
MENKKVLILTATFGMGHQAVSKAIKDEIAAAYLGYSIEIVDLFEIINPSLKLALQKGYNVLTREFEELYNFFYYYKSSAKYNLIDGLIYKGYQKKFNYYIKATSPQIVISTFPMTSGFMSRFKQQHDSDIPLITVITDVVDSWEWIHEDTDRYFVPTQEVKDRLRLKGIPSYRISVTGIPVRRAFKLEQPKPKRTQKKNILIMSSAMGKIKFDHAFLEQLSMLDEAHFTIVTGTDAALFESLKHYHFSNITILGYVEDIATLMSAADLIYTKPGGVTLFEAINTELPLLVQDTAVGQESANIAFIKSREIGVIVEAPDHFIRILKEILDDDLKLYQFRNNMYSLKKEFDQNAIISALLA